MFIYVVLLFQQLIASGTHIIAKVVVQDIEPFTLTMLRSIMAAAGFLIIAQFRGTRFRFDRNDYPMLLLLSFLAVPVNQFLFLLAMKYTVPTNAALFYSATPALVLFVSYLARHEIITWKKGIGVATAFGGILFIVFEKGIDLHSEMLFGNVMLLIAVIAWVFYTVLGRKLIVRYGAFTTSSFTMIVGGLMFLPVGIFKLKWAELTYLSVGDWGSLVYLALGTSIISYWIWYYALGKVPASKVAIFSNLQPILTTILAVVLLGQAITPHFIFGGTVALAGVVLAQFG
jgi:drug/metabolite transporter (DMT)-like permease